MTPKSEHGPSGSDKYKLPKAATALVAALALAACNTAEGKPNPDPSPDKTTQITTTAPGQTESPTSKPSPTMEVSDLPTTMPTNIETTEPPEASPSPQETTPTPEQIVSALRIEAGLSPEEYTEQLIDRFEQWNFAGATEEHWENTYNNYSITQDEAFDLDDAAAAEQAEYFKEALFIPNPSLTEFSIPEYIEQRTYTNAVTLSQWGWNHNRPGFAEFEKQIEIREVMAVDGYEGMDGRRLIIRGTEHNNWEDIEQDITNAYKMDGVEFELRINTKFVDGYELISHIGRLQLPEKVNGEVVPFEGE